MVAVDSSYSSSVAPDRDSVISGGSIYAIITCTYSSGTQARVCAMLVSMV